MTTRCPRCARTHASRHASSRASECAGVLFPASSYESPRLHAAVSLATAASRFLPQVFGDAKEVNLTTSSNTDLDIPWQLLSRTVPPSAGIQSSKPLSFDDTNEVPTCYFATRVPAFAHHSWYLAVATALSPRMAVSSPLMQINRRRRAIEDINPKSWRLYLC